MKSGLVARKLSSFNALALLIWATQFSFAATVAETTKPQRVLALYWYEKDFPANVEFDRGVQKVLQKAGVEYYAEYYEPNRFPGEGQADALKDYLHKKYSERRIDVVIAMSVVSADFLIKYRNDLFPDVPIVFHTSSRKQLNERLQVTNSTGVIPNDTYGRTLEVALQLHPATKHVFVISGTIQHDGWIAKVFREQLSKFENKVEITYLTDLPLDELLARVKNLPEHSIVYYGRQDYDVPGKSLS